MMHPEEAGRTSYRAAVAALDAGEITQLTELLAQYPSLVGDRCRVGEWYETGYFKGATLLLNHAPATAAELVHRGATMDIRHAAGLGRVDAIEALLAAHRDPSLLEEALAFACVRGEGESVRALLGHGARGDVLVTHSGRSPCTALHEAANRGHREIVTVLLAHGADATVVEPQWGGTPAGWAEHGGHPEIAAFLRQHISSSAKG